MKILIADKFPATHIEALKGAAHAVTSDPALEGPTLPAAMRDHEVLIVRSTKVTPEAIDAAPALKLIIRAGSGFDTIATDHAASKGIGVCTCPGTNSVAVAELAMGLMLAVDRHIADCVADARRGVWNKKTYGKASGLKTRTLGLVGIGQIGSEVAKRARAFEMKVVAYDPFVTAEKAAAIGVELVGSALEVAKRADFVSVHVPRTKDTTHLVGAEFFAAMKKGAVLVHTSRGGVVDDEALLKALDERGIRAGLDVFEKEPAATDKEFPNDLAKHPNVVATHHIGASTEQAEEAVADVVLEIVARFAADGTFLHRVN